MMNTARTAVDPRTSLKEPAVLKRILIALIPVIATRIMNKRRDGQQPRADKRRFNRNGH